jgi:hypothetical protein
MLNVRSIARPQGRTQLGRTRARTLGLTLARSDARTLGRTHARAHARSGARTLGRTHARAHARMGARTVRRTAPARLLGRLRSEQSQKRHNCALQLTGPSVAALPQDPAAEREVVRRIHRIHGTRRLDWPGVPSGRVVRTLWGRRRCGVHLRVLNCELKSMDGNKASLHDSGFLFRFRSAKALLDDNPEAGGFQELEKQTIYFARPEALNDPMEGLSDAFWDGDQVLWENLFRHYALSLIWYASAWLLLKPEEIDRAKVSAWITEWDLPTDSLRAIYSEFSSDFRTEIESADLASILGGRTIPLRRERLKNLLFLVHQTALPHLFRVLKKHGLSELELRTAERSDSVKAVVSGWEAIALQPQALEMPVEHQLELMSSIYNRISHQLELGMLSRIRDKNWARKLVALMARFPETYVEAFLRDLHFTPWRVACFSRRCVNASMWGTYGAEHRGAALVFRAEQQEARRFFRVQGMHGTGAQGRELEVRSVTYRNRPPPLDSFLAIGMLPRAKLERTWMKSESGVPSVRLKEVTDDIAAWRKAHWEKAFERATWKHPDWAHEDEQRVIASTAFTDDPAPEPLTYQFSQLEGVIFGMRMSSEDKLRIATLIETKCRAEGRPDFRFFQAYYSPSKGEMDILELGLLRFAPGD